MIVAKKTDASQPLSPEEAKLIADMKTLGEMLDRFPLHPDAALGPIVQPDLMRQAMRLIAGLEVPETERETMAHKLLGRVIRLAQRALNKVEA